jgi:hypothetical protein
MTAFDWEQDPSMRRMPRALRHGLLCTAAVCALFGTGMLVRQAGPFVAVIVLAATVLAISVASYLAERGTP